MKILIADDTKDVARIISEFVLKKGHEADVTFEGQTAKKLLMSDDYDIAFIDHNMPEITGLELVKLVKENRLKTKMVIITGYASMRDSMAKAIGADGYIHKPCDLDEIDAMLRSFSPSGAAASTQAGKVIFVVDNDPQVMRLVSAKLTACGYRVVTALSLETYLAKVASEKPDLVLFDFALIKKDGLDALAAVQKAEGKDKQTGTVPVVILTPRLDESVEKLITGEPAVKGYLIKPFSADELLDRVEEVFEDV